MDVFVWIKQNAHWILFHNVMFASLLSSIHAFNEFHFDDQKKRNSIVTTTKLKSEEEIKNFSKKGELLELLPMNVFISMWCEEYIM